MSAFYAGAVSGKIDEGASAYLKGTGAVHIVRVGSKQPCCQLQCVNGRIDPLPLRARLPAIVSLIPLAALVGAPRTVAVEQPPDLPAWLRGHIGEGEGQI